MNAAVSPDSLSGLALLGKTSMALIVVVLAILLCSQLLKRLNLQRGQSGQLLRVVSSTALGARERVVVVEVEGTWLVLGVTAGQVSKLHELAAPPRPPQAPEQDLSGFAGRLRQAVRQAGQS